MTSVFDDVERLDLRLRMARPWRMSASPFVHGFADRHGGVSRAPYDSLNVGLNVGDDSKAVRTNRLRICEALARRPGQLVTAEQVHGRRIAVVSSEHKGRGSRSAQDSLAGADGLVTNVRGLLLMGFFADCVPILLYDPETIAVGVVHAGWKGTALDAVGAAVRTMAKSFGSRLETIQAAIGPAIGPCCYAVGSEVAVHIMRATGVAPARRQAAGAEAVPGRIVARRKGQLYVDLPGANAMLLQRAGLGAQNVFLDRLCTRCASVRYFSHRGAGGATGRFAAVIGLNG